MINYSSAVIAWRNSFATKEFVNMAVVMYMPDRQEIRYAVSTSSDRLTKMWPDGSQYLVNVPMRIAFVLSCFDKQKVRKGMRLETILKKLLPGYQSDSMTWYMDGWGVVEENQIEKRLHYEYDLMVNAYDLDEKYMQVGRIDLRKKKKNNG